jgi:hypothetical protein
MIKQPPAGAPVGQSAVPSSLRFLVGPATSRSRRRRAETIDPRDRGRPLPVPEMLSWSGLALTIAGTAIAVIGINETWRQFHPEGARCLRPVTRSK